MLERTFIKRLEEYENKIRTAPTDEKEELNALATRISQNIHLSCKYRYGDIVRDLKALHDKLYPACEAAPHPCTDSSAETRKNPNFQSWLFFFDHTGTRPELDNDELAAIEKKLQPGA